jgi:hypothetical protein
MRLDTVIVTPGDSPGWGLRGGDFYVATSGDFVTATDTGCVGADGLD